MTAKEIVFLVIMFETEPIIWLQSFRSDALTWCMRGASMLVDDTVFLVLALVVLFGFDHRRGFTVLLTLLWVALLTAALKSFFAFPRPSDADMRVLLIATGVPNTTPFLSQGATWLLGLPSPDVFSYIRAMPSPDFGIPSGHCSSTVAFWGSLAYLFRKRWMAVIALCLAVIMPVSRMYLGRHFAGDVLAGLLLGGLACLSMLLLVSLLRRNPGTTGGRRWHLRGPFLAIEIAGLVVLPGAFLLVPGTTQTFAGCLLALGAAYFLTMNLDVFDSNRTALPRITTTISALVTVGALQFLLPGTLPHGLALGLVIISVFLSAAVTTKTLMALKNFRQKH